MTKTKNNLTVEPGAIVIFSDLACPFAHVLIHRLHATRTRLGLHDAVHFRHRAFPIELLNSAPGTRHGSDSEIPVLGALEPDAGWQLWQGPDYHYPSTMLAAFEAVHAAAAQSHAVGEQLDRAIRRAFWAQSRPVHLHHELLSIAQGIEGIDVERFEHDLRNGAHRAAVFADYDIARSDTVAMSPHVFLADGTNVANPGIGVRWQGDWAKGFPVIERYEPEQIDLLVQQAATRR